MDVVLRWWYGNSFLTSNCCGCCERSRQHFHRRCCFSIGCFLVGSIRLGTIGHMLRPMFLLTRIVAVSRIPATVEQCLLLAQSAPLFHFSFIDGRFLLSLAFHAYLVYSSMLFGFEASAHLHYHQISIMLVFSHFLSVFPVRSFHFKLHLFYTRFMPSFLSHFLQQVFHHLHHIFSHLLRHSIHARGVGTEIPAQYTSSRG